MKDQKSAMRKSLTLAGIVYAAFTAISVVGPLLLERLWKQKRSLH
jgi:hypothetical protein